MSEFMGQYAFEFLVIQQIQDALRDRDRRMPGIAASSEGIGGIGWDHVDLRHRQADFLSHPFDYVIDAR